MPQPQGAHLVGSINLDTAEETMRLAADVLGEHLRRIPDGEVGERFHWIAFQAGRLAQTDGIEHVGDEPKLIKGVDFRPVTIVPGHKATDLNLAPLGYADAANESYETFARLKKEGAIAEHVRFQVSLPTTLGVVGSFVVPDVRAEFEPVYERALLAELAEITDSIPHEELAIQWDAALEFAHIEGAGYGAPAEIWYADDVWDATTDRLARHIAAVPADVEVGVHLCYGDVGERHFVEPDDTAHVVRFANLVSAKIDRPLTWLHLPVPIERDDAPYFAPLASLELTNDTELYLGLVHRQDGEEGAERRIFAAQRVLTRPFGVGTECGFGRAPEGTTRGLFGTHQKVALPWEF